MKDEKITDKQLLKKVYRQAESILHRTSPGLLKQKKEDNPAQRNTHTAASRLLISMLDPQPEASLSILTDNQHVKREREMKTELLGSAHRKTTRKLSNCRAKSYDRDGRSRDHRLPPK